MVELCQLACRVWFSMVWQGDGGGELVPASLLVGVEGLVSLVGSEYLLKGWLSIVHLSE